METTHVDARRKLTPQDRQDIHRRYYNRLKSGELVQAIADEYNIVRQWVPVVAREVERAKKKKIAPVVLTDSGA